MTSQRDKCPQCLSPEIVPIIYGEPTSEAMDAAARKELVLGGCILSDDNPDTACLACGYSWIGARRAKR